MVPNPRRPPHSFFGSQEVAVIAAETSPSTGRRYGIAQVCRIWEVPRSSFYADRRRTDTTTPVPAQRRGPKPAVSDDALVWG